MREADQQGFRPNSWRYRMPDFADIENAVQDTARQMEDGAYSLSDTGVRWFGFNVLLCEDLPEGYVVAVVRRKGYDEGP